MKWILYAAALVFALLSCSGNSINQRPVNDSLHANTNTTSPSSTDTMPTNNDNTGTSGGEGTTTSGTTTGSSSSHKDSVK